MLRMFGLLLSLTVFIGSVEAAVQSKTVKYKHGDLDCEGYLAWDDSVKGPRPGVLVFHEFWGLDAYAKGRADQLAKLGYIAFAADMYGNGKHVDHPNDARGLMMAVRQNVDDWKKRAVEALDVLKSQPECDKTKIAAIGYCFGGSTCQQLAFAGTDLKAIASFHGGLIVPTPEQVKSVKCKMLICNGADDPLIKQETIKEFKDALDKDGAKYKFENYPGAVHSFTVPDATEAGKKFGAPMAYNKEADEKSWSEMKALFKDALGK